MSDLKPARRAIAKALPNRNGPGYVAQWAAPGLRPAIIKLPSGEPKAFADEPSAEFAAMQKLIEAMNDRQRFRNKQPNQPMHPNDFAADLAGLGITLAEFALIYGVQPDRVAGWISGERDVPHAARVMLALLAMPGGLVVARSISAEAREEANHAQST
jgi:DNA-binding transcriptional regulator YiaG